MIERGPVLRHEPRMRTLAVDRSEKLSPGFVRLTLIGSDLDGFSSVGPTDHVKVLFGDDVRRDYTPRAFRGATADSGPELDIDFFLHGDGIAVNWAAAARAGDEVNIAGPRSSHLPPSGVSRVLLGADETGLPALARWIELLSDDVEIFGFVELAHPSDAAYLDPDHIHRARIIWLDKSAGTLERAVRGFGPIDEETFVWIAGEAAGLIPIRRYLRRELNLPSAHVKIDGYWKRGEAGRDHHAPIDPSDPDD